MDHPVSNQRMQVDDRTDGGSIMRDAREGGPYDFEGTCFGGAGQYSELNRWNLCFTCATDPDHHTYPPEPA